MSLLDEIVAARQNTTNTQGAQNVTNSRRISGEMRAERTAPTGNITPQKVTGGVYKAAESEYNAAQSALQNAIQNAPADIDYEKAMQPYRDRATTAETNLRTARQAYEQAGGIGHSYSGEDRASDIIKGIFQSTGSGLENAAGSIYEGNARGATADWEREQKNLIDHRNEAWEEYRQIFRDSGGNAYDPKVVAALQKIQDINSEIDMYRKALAGSSGLQGTAQALYDRADKTAAESARNIYRAKSGLGEAGQAAVDVGVAGGQMLLDAAIGAATGTGMLPVIGLRSFGSGAQEARQAGADYQGQALYGIGSAAVEMATEKLADGLAGLAGKGIADDVAEEVIRRLATSDAGRTVLRTLYGMGGEAAEEAISSLVNPLLKATYDKGVAAKQSYLTPEGRKELLADTAYDALIGGLLGGLGSAGSIATGQNAAKNAGLLLSDAGLGNRNSQINNAWDVLTGKDTAENQRAKENAALMRLLGLESTEAQISPVESIQPDSLETAPPIQQGAAEAASQEFNLEQRRDDSGDATESQLRAEWEAQHPELREETKPNMMPDGETVYVSDRLTNSIPSIEGMEPVANLSTGDLPSISTDSLLDRARAMFEKIFGIVNRKGFGDVEINKRGAKNDLSHGNGAAKTAVIPAIPAIIESGEQIDFQKNWKGRPYDGYTFAAPIILDGKTVYVAAVVLQTSKNKFYLHEVVDSDGNYIKFGDTSEANRTSLAVNDDAGTSDVSPNMGDASPISNIPQSIPVVNGENGLSLPTTAATTAESTNGRGRERERGVSKDVRTNPNTDEPLRDSFEQNREMYHQLTNAEVTERANAIIDKGFDAARSEVEQAIGRAKAGMKLPPEIAVAGYQIANEMSRRGDLASARSLCADIAAELTAGGQLGQIGRLILSSDPSIKAMTVQKIVDKFNNQLSARQKAKNQKRGVGDESGQITLDDALVQEYANAETDEASDAAMDKIEQSIANQIPATFRDKFTALRYLNMLGNLKTQIRNIVGNTAMMAATNVKYTAQSVSELAAAAVSDKYQRNTSLLTSPELRQQAKADFDAHSDEIMGESKYSDVKKQASRNIADKQRVFDNPLLEGYRKATSWAMEQGDAIFGRIVYVRAFAGWMKAHGITDISTATAEQVSQARAFAAKEAQEATFHDSNAVSDAVSRAFRGEKIHPVVKALSEGVMPFRKTPANVAVRAVEYSPVGVAETIYKGVQAAKGKASAAEVINSAAKNATGTALAIAGYFLAAAGKARASGNEEDEDLNAFQKMRGAMDYSVKVGDTYVSLSQFAPMAIPFFMGVKLEELLSNADEPLSLDDTGKILGVISDPMLEMSMLQGVNDFLGNIASLNGDADALPSLVANAALSYLSQGITNSLLGQAEQAYEKNRQTTYTDTRSKEATNLDKFLASKGQQQISKMSAKIPGWDYHQQDYVDAWGRTQSNGEAGERVFNAFLNPTYTSGDRSTAVDNELERLHSENKDVEGFPNVFPEKRSRSAVIGKGVVMTPDEYFQYSEDAGKKKLNLVGDFMDSQEYKTMNDSQRAAVIKNLYEFADDQALQNIRDANGVNRSTKWDKVSDLESPVDYLAAKQSLTDEAEAKGKNFNANSNAGFEAFVGKGINNADLDMLAESSLSKTRLPIYSILRGAGYTPKQYISELEGADADGNGSYKQNELYKWLAPKTDLTVEQKQTVWENLSTGKTSYQDYAKKNGGDMSKSQAQNNGYTSLLEALQANRR